MWRLRKSEVPIYNLELELVIPAFMNWSDVVEFAEIVPVFKRLTTEGNNETAFGFRTYVDSDLILHPGSVEGLHEYRGKLAVEKRDLWYSPPQYDFVGEIEGSGEFNVREVGIFLPKLRITRGSPDTIPKYTLEGFYNTLTDATSESRARGIIHEFQKRKRTFPCWNREDLVKNLPELEEGYRKNISDQ